MKLKTNIVVDVLSNDNLTKDGSKKFSQDNCDIAISLIVREAYPEYFGEGITKGLELDNDCIRLVDDSLINWSSRGSNITQSSRAGSKNPKFKEVSQDISNYGYKLRNIPILVCKNDDGTYTPINGRTRTEILRSFGFTNFICIVYKASKGVSNKKKLDAISKMSLKANAENDPAGDLMIEDVYTEGCYAIDNDFITLTGNYDQDLVTIRARVDEVCGEGTFTDLKRSAVTYRILNTYNKFNQVISWSVKGATDEWLKNSKFKTINAIKNASGDVIKRGIKYIVVSSETLDKSLMRAISTAFDNQDYKIRVIIHTGTLKGFDVVNNYAEKIWNFRSLWTSQITKMAYSFFNNKKSSADNIELYGALSAVAELGDLDNMKKFVDYNASSFDELEKTGDYNDGLEDVDSKVKEEVSKLSIVK